MGVAEVEDIIRQGEELMAVREFVRALELFEEALAKDNRNYDAYIDAGNALVNLQRLADGITSFKKALLLQPDSTTALYSLACAYFLDGNNVEALKYFNRCEKLGFVSEEMYGILEAMFIDANDPVQAIRYVNKAIQLNPLNPQHYIDKAQMQLLNDSPKEAIASLREVEELLPDAGEPYLVEIQIYEQTEEYEQAIAVADRALQRFPEDAALYLAKARVLVNQEEFVLAGEALSQAQVLAEDQPALLREIALQFSVVQLGLKEVEGSVHTLENVINGSPDDQVALFILLSECYGLEQYDKALAYAQQVLALPDVEPRVKASAVFWKASSLKELGREDEAREAFKEARSALRQITIGNPGLLEVYVFRALCHKEVGEFEMAHELIDHVISMSPDTAASYSFKAEIFDAEGKPDEAAEQRAKVLSLDPDFVFPERKE